MKKKNNEKAEREKLRDFDDIPFYEIEEVDCRGRRFPASIPCNAVKYESFQVAIEAIGQCGPRMKAPSYHFILHFA